jgi:hypothetical protein
MGELCAIWAKICEILEEARKKLLTLYQNKDII